MQPTLFGTLPDESTKNERGLIHTVQRSRTEQRQSPGATEPTRGLFGIVETKKQAKQRAQEIARLLGAVEDAPIALACCEAQIQTLEYFIERSERTALDPNDRDGLLREVGDLEELLTDEDCQSMRDNPKIWRPYPCGWLGKRCGDMYAAALHPKEIAYLRGLQSELHEDLTTITEGAKQCQLQLDQLRAVGQLPDDIAKKYALTPDGTRCLKQD